MTIITPHPPKQVVCPVCWRTLSFKRWQKRGCCLTPQERESEDFK